MALRNTLLVCAAIVAGGAIAGLTMRPHPYGYQQPYDTGSNSFGQAQPDSPPPPESIVPLTAPTAPAAQTVALSQIDQADRILQRMPVESANGQRIGEVAHVTMDGSGHAREIVLERGERISADDLVFLPARSVLVAQVAPGVGPDQPRDPYGPRGDAPGNYGPPNNGDPNGYGNGPPQQQPAGPPNDYGPPRDAPSGYGQPSGSVPPGQGPDQRRRN